MTYGSDSDCCRFSSAAPTRDAGTYLDLSKRRWALVEAGQVGGHLGAQAALDLGIAGEVLDCAISTVSESATHQPTSS